MALEFLSNLIGVVDIIGVDKDTILQSLKSEMKDFEDAIQIKIKQSRPSYDNRL
ncbi:MAG: hypothetical protein ACLFQM_12065 [Fidelibacterota bacterium]